MNTNIIYTSFGLALPRMRYVFKPNERKVQSMWMQRVARYNVLHTHTHAAHRAEIPVALSDNNYTCLLFMAFFLFRFLIPTSVVVDCSRRSIFNACTRDKYLQVNVSVFFRIKTTKQHRSNKTNGNKLKRIREMERKCIFRFTLIAMKTNRNEAGRMFGVRVCRRRRRYIASHENLWTKETQHEQYKNARW